MGKIIPHIVLVIITLASTGCGTVPTKPGDSPAPRSELVFEYSDDVAQEFGLSPNLVRKGAFLVRYAYNTMTFFPDLEKGMRGNLIFLTPWKFKSTAQTRYTWAECRPGLWQGDVVAKKRLGQINCPDGMWATVMGENSSMIMGEIGEITLLSYFAQNAACAKIATQYFALTRVVPKDFMQTRRKVCVYFPG